jgi:hypothetical protein
VNVVPPGHKWEFQARFRRHAFGWRSRPASLRIKQAVSEIKKTVRRDPLLAADGAVRLLERISPALEHVDSSSGAIGTAVNNAIAQLVPIIVDAPADATTREKWLERLWEAYQADEMPYIEQLGDYWGELCASKELAAAWANRLLGITRLALSPDTSVRGFFCGTSACLSALYRAERYQEIVELVGEQESWPYKSWAVKALAGMGKKPEAIRSAEASRGPWTSDSAVDRLCEEIVLSSGLADEAYRRYGLRANRAGTYLATFQAVARKYPHKSPSEILHDLVQTTPGNEGKWFAAAKEEGLYAEALELASASPCDPRTLSRAARDLTAQQPDFAIGAGLLALHWLARGFGHEVTGSDVWTAFSSTVAAAERTGRAPEVRARIRQIISDEDAGGLVTRVLGREFGM